VCDATAGVRRLPPSRTSRPEDQTPKRSPARSRSASTSSSPPLISSARGLRYLWVVPADSRTITGGRGDRRAGWPPRRAEPGVRRYVRAMADPQDVTPSAEKDPDDWTTGDEPMTGPQRSYLHTLAQQAGVEAPPDDLSKADASKAIDELQSKAGRGG